jgi:hypothetical protein
MGEQKPLMKKTLFCVIPVLLVLLLIPLTPLRAQTNSAALVSATFDTSDFPQWAKDLRRFEIVAFGSFPFSMFTTTFIMDSYRWNNNSGMSWSEEGRRYAPWPFKSAGAVEMTSREHEMTLAIAAGLSAAVALTDFIIVQIKRQKARKRAESLPPGTAIIIKRPWPESGAEEDGGAGNGESGVESGGLKTAPDAIDFPPETSTSAP